MVATSNVSVARDLSIGVDIGGTFTDCIVAFDDGTIVGGKSPTTPHDRSLGFFSAIERVAEKLSLPVSELMIRCRRLVHGTTTGTNAIVSREGAEVGLLTTAGHGDALSMMRGSGRTAGLPADDLLNISETYKPQSLVPRHRVREIPERMDVDGEEIVPLDEDAVVAAARHLVADGVEAIAVSFLWSVKNPSHEQRAVELVQAALPEIFVTCGSGLVGTMGEYERTTTAVMNAYIGPLMLRYIDAIESGASQRGYTREVLFAQCGGGAITVSEARQAPIRTVQSGPVAGIIATERLAARIGEPNVLAADMGGTTFDVSVIRDGEPLERSTSLFERLELALPMFDVESIGAGGGSIAWLDETGRLNVGPRSAGADPGPACYGRGEYATTTDADVVLGLIDPEKYLGGRMRIDPGRSAAAVGRLADQLGLGLHETAAGISRIVDARMADLIRRMSVMRGFDPRKFCCFAFGGGGPVHAAAVAREAGVARVIVPLPVTAALWSAVGAATADVVHVFQSPHTFEEPFDGKQLEEEFSRMEDQGLAQLLAEGFDHERIALSRRLRMKYAMQVHDVEVPVDAIEDSRAGVDGLVERFGVIYENLFGAGSGFREGGVAITGFQLRAIGRTEKGQFAALNGGELADAAQGDRDVYWYENGKSSATPVWEIGYGQRIPSLVGPALVQLPDSVVAIRPGQTAEMDALGNIIIHVEGVSA